MKHPFFFDYIYYRVTKAYFKWDGRTGATGLAAVTMIQVFLITDFAVILTRAFLDRYVFAPYANQIATLFFGIVVVLMILNYRRYVGRYSKLKIYWKEEQPNVRRMKGFLVVVSIILPWVPLILLGLLD
jgi:hypothetical protein